MGIIEILDKIFGGGEKRGLLQGILMIVLAIVLWIISGILTLVAAGGMFIAILTLDASALLIATAAAGVFGGLAYIPLILGIVGIVWWILRSKDIVS